MKGFHSLRGGMHEQMTATVAAMYRSVLMVSRIEAAQKNRLRMPRGTKMRIHSSKMAAFANNRDAE